MIVSTKELFKHAYGKYAVGAYNINNAEQVMGLFRGNCGHVWDPAKGKKGEWVKKPELAAPFIIQLSKGAREYTDKRMLEAMIRAADEIFPDAIFAVHLDHGDEAACMDCIASGFYSSVMIDASHESLEKNIEITKKIVQAAHAKNIVVEAELGQLGGVEEHVSVSEDKAHLTDPAQVEEFVKKSGCDSLACAIGTSHGAYKFSGGQGIHFNVIQEIQKRLPGFPLVMHGSSSVPQDEVQRINAAGGKLKGAKGVDEAQITKAATMGVTKVNIDTDGRLVWCRVLRESFRDKPDNFDLRPPGKVFMAEYAKYIAHKNQVLGSAGKLDEVRKFLRK